MAIRNAIAALLLLSSLFLHSGCGTTGMPKNPFGTARQDEEHPADDKQEEWDFVGDEARKHRATEKDPDPWWQNYIMSDRAQAIERSLGVE
jgi:hypothetical protein